MEAKNGQSGQDAYRAVCDLIRQKRQREALDLAQHTLLHGTIGRKHAARLHSLICGLYLEDVDNVATSAILHGEEAVRIADLVGDPWTKCEALTRLIQAYCRIGDRDRANLCCEHLSVEVERNSRVIAGGRATLDLLRATVSAVDGDTQGCLALLDRAESAVERDAPQVIAGIRTQKLGALASHGRFAEARQIARKGVPISDEDERAGLEWMIARAWLAYEEANHQAAQFLLQDALERARTSGPRGVLIQCLVLQALLEAPEHPDKARQMAQAAFHRAIASGRLDLARQCRQKLRALL